MSDIEWRGVGKILVFVVLGIGTLMAALYAYGRTADDFSTRGRFLPEIVLVILIVVGLIGLVLVLAILVSVFRTLGLTDTTASLGLPEGSVQAIIALSLILIFATMTIFLYQQLKGTPRTLPHLTQEQVNEIPPSQVIEQSPSRDEKGNGIAGLFDVIIATPQDEASKNFAQQVGTTVSTLVVAVAGFYFGSRAVSGASRALRTIAAATSLRILSPVVSPVLGKVGQPLTIQLEVVPDDEPVSGSVTNDDPRQLHAVDPSKSNKWVYTPSNEAREKTVTLTFSLSNRPESPARTLDVHVEGPAPVLAAPGGKTPGGDQPEAGKTPGGDQPVAGKTPGGDPEGGKTAGEDHPRR